MADAGHTTRSVGDVSPFEIASITASAADRAKTDSEDTVLFSDLRRITVFSALLHNSAVWEDRGVVTASALSVEYVFTVTSSFFSLSVSLSVSTFSVDPLLLSVKLCSGVFSVSVGGFSHA